MTRRERRELKNVRSNFSSLLIFLSSLILSFYSLSFSLAFFLQLWKRDKNFALAIFTVEEEEGSKEKKLRQEEN